MDTQWPITTLKLTMCLGWQSLTLMSYTYVRTISHICQQTHQPHSGQKDEILRLPCVSNPPTCKCVTIHISSDFSFDWLVWAHTSELAQSAEAQLHRNKIPQIDKYALENLSPTGFLVKTTVAHQLRDFLTTVRTVFVSEDATPIIPNPQSCTKKNDCMGRDPFNVLVAPAQCLQADFR